MNWSERTPRRLRGGGDRSSAWCLVAALLIVLAAVSCFEPGLTALLRSLL